MCDKIFRLTNIILVFDLPSQITNSVAISCFQNQFNIYVFIIDVILNVKDVQINFFELLYLSKISWSTILFGALLRGIRVNGETFFTLPHIEFISYSVFHCLQLFDLIVNIIKTLIQMLTLILPLMNSLTYLTIDRTFGCAHQLVFVMLLVLNCQWAFA